MTDLKIIGSAAQPDPPGTVTVICNCRTTPMQREEVSYIARCRHCGIATKVFSLGVLTMAPGVFMKEVIQERTY